MTKTDVEEDFESSIFVDGYLIDDNELLFITFEREVDHGLQGNRLNGGPFLSNFEGLTSAFHK